MKDRIDIRIDGEIKKEFNKILIDCDLDMTTALKQMMIGVIDTYKVNKQFRQDWLKDFRRTK